MNVEQWAIYGLLWPNGAGKTTILKVLAGSLHADDGEIILCGESWSRDSLNHLGVLINHPMMYKSNNAYKNMRIYHFLDRTYGEKVDYDGILDLVGLPKDSYENATKTYSLGMMQRLSIAVALTSKPKVLILDEPLNGIDIEWVIEMREIFKKLQAQWCTIIVSSHILSEIEKTCTHIWIFNDWVMKYEWLLSDIKEKNIDIEQHYLNLINSKYAEYN